MACPHLGLYGTTETPLQGVPGRGSVLLCADSQLLQKRLQQMCWCRFSSVNFSCGLGIIRGSKSVCGLGARILAALPSSQPVSPWRRLLALSRESQGWRWIWGDGGRHLKR